MLIWLGWIVNDLNVLMFQTNFYISFKSLSCISRELNRNIDLFAENAIALKATELEAGSWNLHL